MDAPPDPFGSPPAPAKDQYACFPLLYDPTLAVSGVLPSCSASCGNLLLPMDSSRRTSSSCVKVEDWVMIKDAMQAAAKTEVPDQTKIDMTGFGDLYTSSISYDYSGNEIHIFELETPEMIVWCSDEYQTWLKRPNANDDTPFPQDSLHFTQALGMPSSFCLAKLFKTIQIYLQPGSESLIGFAFPYDAEADGNRGAALSITGQSQPQAVSDSLAPPSTVSMPLPLSLPSPLSSLPAPLAALLGQQSDDEPSLDDIIDMSYDNAKVNADVQSMILQIMIWHIDPEDRNVFCGTEEKPNNLDPSFTARIQSEIATWIKNEYFPAYICRMLATNNGSISTPYSFTSQELNSINYWWTGKGTGTLSASKEYKFLSQAVQRYVTLQTYPLVAKLYEGGRGCHYSDLLYQKVTASPRLLAGLQNRDPQTGTSQLTKICCIMDALDQGRTTTETVPNNATSSSTTQANSQSTQPPDLPGHSHSPQITNTNSNLLALRALTAVRKEAWSQQFWGIGQMTDNKVQIAEQQWLSDCLEEILTMIIDKDPSLSGVIITNLYAEIDAISGTVLSWSQMDMKSKLQQLSSHFDKHLTDFMDFLCMASRTSWRNNDVVHQYLRGMARVQAAASAVSSKATDNTGEMGCTEAFAKTVWAILGTTAFLCAAINLTGQWSATQSPERASMIANVVSSLSQVTELGTDAWGAFIQDGSSPSYSAMVELMLSRQLDVYVSQVLESASFDAVSFDRWTNLLEEMQSRATSTSQATSIIEPDNPPSVNQNLSLSNLLSDPQQVVGWRKGFNIASPVLAKAEYTTSTALVIFFTSQLTKDSTTINERYMAFSDIQLALAAIGGGGSPVSGTSSSAIANLGLNGAEFGYGSAVAACCTAFAAVGPVLAGLCVIPNMVPFIWSSISSSTPPPVEMWLQDKGKPWADSVATSGCPIVISSTPASVACSQSATQAIKITITNTGTTPTVSQGLNFQFTTGPEDGTLFYNECTIVSVSGGASGTVTMQTSDSNLYMTIQNQTYQPSPGNSLTRTNISIKAHHELTLAVGETITLQLNGIIWCDDGSDAIINYAQAWNGDSWNGTLAASRTKS
ncbi:hypothetical protein FSARC_12110 [Fusarium sarcochroum]|uniref:Uncharacterized protein n=1 Tax=Fusarium sarcochroum TaxID=1208366 RepID=A0A8H4WXW9_9HYPO|nr:hypothetical protein FSARC_12110 [Fusarium sarcochroum]